MLNGLITPKSILFTTPSGKPINVTDAHPAFKEMCETFRAAQAAKRDGRDDEAAALVEKLIELSQPARKIVVASQGTKVSVRSGIVYYGDEPIHNAITDRILWGLSEGYDMQPYIRFLENLMENPSKSAVDELYLFMEANSLAITEDGCLTTYKKVRDDYKDIYSGKFDNSVGAKPSMRRNDVDDRRNVTCSKGLHVCSFSYLPNFGGSGSRVMICKVNPRDVVSIPSDYNNAKMRCCAYEVIGEVPPEETRDILSSKPVFALSDFSNGYDDDWVDRDYDEDENDCGCDEDEIEDRLEEARENGFETGFDDGFEEGKREGRAEALRELAERVAREADNIEEGGDEDDGDEWRGRYNKPY